MKKLITILSAIFAIFLISCNGKKIQQPKETISPTATTQEKVEFYAKNSQNKDDLQKVEILGVEKEIAHIKYNQSLWHSEDVYLKELCYVYPDVAKDIFNNCSDIKTIVFWFMLDEESTLVRCELNRSTFEKIPDIASYKASCTLDYNNFIDSVDAVYIYPNIKAKLTKLKSKRRTN